MTGASAPAPVGSLEELKRVKDAETEWAERLKTARDQTEARLKGLRESAEGAVALARTQGQKLKEEKVRVARETAEKEAAQIQAEGDRQAESALTGAGKRAADRNDAILAAVLGEFGSE